MEDRGPRAGGDASVAFGLWPKQAKAWGRGLQGDDVIPGPDEKGRGFRNAPAQDSVPPPPADGRRSRGADGDFLVTVRATPGGVARAKVTGRWAKPDGRVSRLPVWRARGRARCPLPARTLTRGDQAGRATAGADLLCGARSQHPGRDAQGPQSEWRTVPPGNRALGRTSCPVPHRPGACPLAWRAARKGSA